MGKYSKCEDLFLAPFNAYGAHRSLLDKFNEILRKYEEIHEVCPQVFYMRSAGYPVDVSRYSKSIKSSRSDAASSGSNVNPMTPLSAEVEFTE
jgi:hypothetical protein